MEWKKEGSEIFVRLDPGEPLVESLRTVAASLAVPSLAIVSGVGMLDQIELGFFDPARDDYARTHMQGIHDLSSVMGNILRHGQGYTPHVHAVFNDPKHVTYSGHVMEARCHITVELFLSLTVSTLERTKIAGCPSTRIMGTDASKHA